LSFRLRRDAAVPDTNPNPLPKRGLTDNGYGELPIMSEHLVAIESLPPFHKDPFDRLLVAQATVEGIRLLTMDSWVAQYPGPVVEV
jgi:PIN domain nuclease of toxin-antitoxin system